MKKMKKFAKRSVLALTGIAMSAAPALATSWIDVSTIDVDTSPVATLTLTILTALGTIWVVRKLIKTVNKS